MSEVKVTLNRKNVGALLKSPEFAAMVNKAAHAVAADIGDEAKVDEYTTDRKAAAVSVPAHLQATEGALTRSAGKLGLEVRGK